MFRRVFSKPLSLHIGDVELTFASSSELEFALSAGLDCPRRVSLVWHLPPRRPCARRLKELNR